MAGRLLGILLSTWLALGILVGSDRLPSASGAELGTAPSATEQQVIDLTNAERAKVGLPALVFSAPLATSARNYAAYMARANFFGHVAPDGSTLVTRDQAAGYGTYTFLGENLAAGQTSPEAAMAGWMASPSHRANILSANAREIGVGFATGGRYGYYWVQEFGARPVEKQVATTASTSAPPAPAPAARAAAPTTIAPSVRASAPTARSDRPASAGPSAAQPAPASIAPSSWTSPKTGYTISGDWLATYRAWGGLDSLGEPRSPVIVDPVVGGQLVQFFQRAVLEFHPENAEPYRIQRRLLGQILDPGIDDPVSPNAPPPGAYSYFPLSAERPTGLGHFVADQTRSGQPIYFKDYFDRHGGVNAFGYPMEEPKLRDGRWTQRFQAATFEYHPENDRDGTLPGTNVPYRQYRVQLALIGDRYLEWLTRPPMGRQHGARNLALDAEAM